MSSRSFSKWASGLPDREGWLTPSRCLICPSCYQPPAFFYHECPLFAVLVCQTPSPRCPVESWTVCKLCPDPRKHSFDRRCQKYYHGRTFHKDVDRNSPSVQPNLSVEPNLDRGGNETPIPHLQYLVDGASVSTPPKPVVGTYHNVDSNSDVYFGMELESALGDSTFGGMEWLVGKSVLGRSNFHPVNDGFSKLSVRLALKFAEFAMGLSKAQQEAFCNLQRLSLAVQEEQKEKKRGPSKSPGLCFQLPVDHHSLRQVITEGKYSFLRNLPHQPALCHGRVSYASIVGCIQEQMGHGIPREAPHYLWKVPGSTCLVKTYEDIPPQDGSKLVTTHWSNSYEARAVLKRAREAVPGINPRDVHLLIWWGDDYESNFCKTDGDTSVHKESLTVGCPPLCPSAKGARAYCYTHPLIIGPKSNYDSYIEVGNFHNKELAKLCCREYSTGARLPPLLLFSQTASLEAGRPTHVPVYAEVLFSLQDQPERRKVNCLLGGNSNNHARFGYNLNFKPLVSSMPSCSRCQGLLQKNLPGPDSCQDCYSWYPENRLTHCSLDLNKLKRTVDTVHNKIYSMELNTQAKVVDAMKEGCFDRRYALVVQQHAHRAIAKRKWEQDGDLSHNDYMSKHPRKFLQADYPTPFSRPLWSLHKQLDVPMHMLFLGVVKTIQIFLVYWMRAKGLNTAFVQCMEGRLESVAALSLSYCKAKAYGKSDKFGGTLSENWLANARLLPWIYAPLCFPMKRDPRYVEPDLPVEQWSANQCQLWMVAHGFSKGRKKRDELRREIRRLKNPQNAECLALAEDKCGSMDEMQHLVCATTGLVHRFMSNRADPDHVSSLHRHVRVFLDAFEAMDKARRGEGSVPHQAFATVDEIAQEGEVDPHQEEEEAMNEADQQGEERVQSAVHAQGLSHSSDQGEDCEEDKEATEEEAEMLLALASRKSEKSRKLPQWLTKYNFVCLPNLAKSVGRFGPARHLWEGGWLGEKGITDSKHATTRGGSRKDGWASNQMRHELRIGSLRRLKWRADADATKNSHSRNERGQVRMYGNEQEVVAALETGKPVSARWCGCFGSTGSLVCAIADRSSAYPQEVSLSLSASSTRKCLGYTYFSLTYRPVRRHQCGYGSPLYCVLLPWFLKSKDEEIFYAVISHQWSVMARPGCFEIYSIPGLEYADTDRNPDPAR